MIGFQCPVNLVDHIRVKEGKNTGIHKVNWLKLCSWPKNRVLHIPCNMCWVTVLTLLSVDEPRRLQHTGKGRQHPHPLRQSPFHHGWGGLEPWDPLDKTAGHAASPASDSKNILCLDVSVQSVTCLLSATHQFKQTSRLLTKILSADYTQACSNTYEHKIPTSKYSCM